MARPRDLTRLVLVGLAHVDELDRVVGVELGDPLGGELVGVRRRGHSPNPSGRSEIPAVRDRSRAGGSWRVRSARWAPWRSRWRHAPSADPIAAPAEPRSPLRPQLPRGGQRIFPDFRVVAFYGAPQHRNLGILGIGSPDRAAARLRRQARRLPRAAAGRCCPASSCWPRSRSRRPGADGKYRARQPRRVIDRYLRAARRARAILILDVQPGRSDFMTEARRLEPWLRQPDVSLALDPEWNMGPRGVPGRSIGHVSAGMVNRVSAYLDRIVRRQRPAAEAAGGAQVHRLDDPARSAAFSSAGGWP